MDKPVENRLQLLKTLNEIKDQLFSDIEVNEVNALISDGTYTTSEQVKSHPVR